MTQYLPYTNLLEDPLPDDGCRVLLVSIAFALAC